MGGGQLSRALGGYGEAGLHMVSPQGAGGLRGAKPHSLKKANILPQPHRCPRQAENRCTDPSPGLGEGGTRLAAGALP